MSLTLANSIIEVRDSLNEATAVFWSDAQITKWIQEGCRIFSSKTLMVEGTDDLTLIASRLSYASTDDAWIADMIEPYAAIYNNTAGVIFKGLVKIHPRQIGNIATNTAGPPKYYTMHNRKVYVFPLANAGEVTGGGIVTMLYAKVTDDITTLTDEYQHLPIIYAVAKAKQRDEKYSDAQALLSQFYQEVAFERTDKHSREVDSLDKFKVPAKGGGDR